MKIESKVLVSIFKEQSISMYISTKCCGPRYKLHNDFSFL